MRDPSTNEPWDLSKKSVQDRVRKMVVDSKPFMLVGSPPCTPFSIWNYAMNDPKVDPDRVRAMVAEARIH